MTREETVQDQFFHSIVRWQDFDIDRAKLILTEHPELINAKRIGDWQEGVTTPLIEACGPVSDAVKFLLDNGADVSVTGNIGKNFYWIFLNGGFGSRDDIFPLCAAVEHCDQHWKIDELLSTGADVNQTTAMGQTALHVICTSMEYDGDPKIHKKKVMQTLIDHGADVDICDHHGKSPLHYACQHGKKDLTMILLLNGADVDLEDNVGLTPLDYAAIFDYDLTISIMDIFSFPAKQTVRAYECVALEAPDPYEILRKASLLREEHKIKKSILPPLECYGFIKEWETTEELEKYKDNEVLLRLQSLLAKERISVERNFDRELTNSDLGVFGKLWKNKECELWKSPKYPYNSLFKHKLDRYSYCGDHLNFSKMIHGGIDLRGAAKWGKIVSTDLLVKFIHVAIESCCAIQDRLNIERKPGFINELIHEINHNLHFIAEAIVHLIKRSDNSFSEEPTAKHDDRGNNGVSKSCTIHKIAKALVDALLHSCPVISAPFYAYFKPVTHLFFDRHCHSTLHRVLDHCICSRYNNQFLKMVMETQSNMNVTDSDGNTILHVALSRPTPKPHKTEQFMHMVEMLLKNGAYPHAKNKNGRYPSDELPGSREPCIELGLYDNIVASIRDLLAKYDSRLTLTYLAAVKIKEFKIPYRNMLPETMVQFVDLH